RVGRPMPASPPQPFPASAPAETPTREASALPVPALVAARERVVQLLTDRYADDSLTVEEFEAELDRLHATHDVASLQAMAHALAAPRATWSDTGSAPATRTAPRQLVADAARVLAFMGNAKRRGAWHVPERIRAVAVMGEIVLDLRDAIAESDDVEIEI